MWNHAPIGSIGIAFACVIGFVYTLRFPRTNLWFSGRAIESGEYWVWVSATFTHASASHMSNNMIMFLAFSIPMEAFNVLNGVSLVILFIITGASGWMYALQHNRKVHKDLWEQAAKFIESCGSSPATYGILFYGLAVAPLLPLRGIPWLWIWAVICVPICLSRKYSVYWYSHPFRCVLFSVVTMTLLKQGLEGVSVLLWHWMVIYFAKVYAQRLFDHYFLSMRREHDSSDALCHVGGSVFGYVCGSLISYFTPSMGFANSPYVCSEIDALLNGYLPDLCYIRVSVWICLMYLIAEIKI